MKTMESKKRKTLPPSQQVPVTIKEDTGFDKSIKSRLFSGHSKVTYASTLTGGIG